MDISAIIKAVVRPQTERSGQNLLNLQPGDKLTGKVLQIESDGRVQIDLGGTRIVAQVGFAVKQGQTLRLTIVESGTLLHLRADLPAAQSKQPPDSQANPATTLTAVERQELIQSIDRIIPRLAGQGTQSAMIRSIANALRQIKAAFTPLPMDKPAVEVAQWLRSALENHGALFEKRLADAETAGTMPPTDTSATTIRDPGTSVRAIISRDLKPQLIILKHFLEGGDAVQSTARKIGAKEAALLRNSVGKMLRHVEQNQERAVTRSREGEPFQLFSHLLPMANRQPPVRLKIYYPRKGGQGRSTASLCVALLLDMDHLGLVRGDITKLDDALHVRFFVQDESVGNRFNSQLSDIESILAGSFDQVRVDVSVSKEKIDQFYDDDIRDTASAGIDIKA